MIECPICGKSASKNGTRRGKQQYYCTGPVRHFFRIEQKTNPIMEKTIISEQEFREQYDNHLKIQIGIKNLKEGELILQRDFKDNLKLVGNPPNSIFDYEEFEPYKGRVGDKIFWSHPKTIERLKNDRLLR